VQHSGLRGM